MFVVRVPILVMDALYFLRHSRSDDLEIRYSLRALARHFPGVRKVWVFGDRPAFLSGDTAFVEHVPNEYVVRTGNFRTPVSNFFLMFWLSSRWPRPSRHGSITMPGSWPASQMP